MNSPPFGSTDQTAPRRGRYRPLPAMTVILALAAVAALILGLSTITPGHPDIPTRPSVAAPPVPGCATPTAPASGTGQRAPLPVIPAAASDRPAYQILAALANHAVASGDPPCGRYAHLHVKTWTVDPAGTAVLTEQQSWRAPDDSGRVLASAGTAEPPQARDYPPGAMPGTIPGGLSPDPAVLAGQLNDIHPWAEGPRSAIRDLADVYATYRPGTPGRVALLILAANATGLFDAGAARDLLGRAGTAVAVDSDQGATHDVIILDPAGVPLAYGLARRDQAGSLHLVEYRLYVTVDTTMAVGVGPMPASGSRRP